jgi:ATP-dependent DNA helicase RecG
MYGTRQSGALDFRIADIVQDAAIVEQTKSVAEQILEQDPLLHLPEHRALHYALHHGSKGESTPWSKIS